MGPEVDDRLELDALGDLVLTCRERSRALGDDMLTYYLDMAVHAAHQIPSCGSGRGAGTVRTPRPASDAPVEGGEAGSVSELELRRRLVDLRTLVEGCRDRALDVHEDVLVYILDMAAVTIARTLLLHG